jgi:hypothetical protein
VKGVKAAKSCARQHQSGALKDLRINRYRHHASEMTPHQSETVLVCSVQRPRNFDAR